jgi:hypothetical protein
MDRMACEADPKCPKCKKALTLTEVFFGRCQLCLTDFDPEREPEKKEPRTHAPK